MEQGSALTMYGFTGSGLSLGYGYAGSRVARKHNVKMGGGVVMVASCDVRCGVQGSWRWIQGVRIQGVGSRTEDLTEAVVRAVHGLIEVALEAQCNHRAETACRDKCG